MNSTDRADRLVVESIDLFERDVILRMPFRFGVVTLTAAPQAFARVRIRLEDGRQAEGMSAELVAACDMRVSIPGSGAVESLNVAAATAVFLAQWKQRL